jgi:hypothetical protein
MTKKKRRRLLEEARQKVLQEKCVYFSAENTQLKLIDIDLENVDINQMAVYCGKNVPSAKDLEDTEVKNAIVIDGVNNILERSIS